MLICSKLTSAVANTSKKKCGKEFKTDWVEISSLVPGRTRKQCMNRWHTILDTNIDRTTGRTGTWIDDEDIKLKDAVQTHGGKDWATIATLVPGRTRKQCCNRWKDVLDPSIASTAGRTGKWTAVEDSKLKHVVQKHGDKDWVTISALVPGRTRKQCWQRWEIALNPSIDRANERTGKWTAVENSKLKHAVQTHGDKDWAAISALVPCRTKNQCWKRWHNGLDPSIDRANRLTGKWSEDEDSKLKNAVQKHGGKDWDATTALVPGRTKRQCQSRWQVLRRSPEQE
jgi:myb proto-oncogene protein